MKKTIVTILAVAGALALLFVFGMLFAPELMVGVFHLPVADRPISDETDIAEVVKMRRSRAW